MSFILDALPTPADFFQTYWNKKPFAVRGMISEDVIASLIDADHLAGLSMEEDVKSRLVRKGPEPKDWRCDYGPFEDEIFVDLGETDWSLLVQNIDQYHDETAELLTHFNFCPRWLLDDIMVSFSPKGGTVGAHVDSYHVFLVQGAGKRRWKVAREAIQNEDYIDGIPLEILTAPFHGDEITVTEGDVIYIPPKFAHQGVSLEPSLTYSVGFLGPSLPEMLSDFGHYIEEHQTELPRYLGQDLTETASPFQLGTEHADDLRSFMTDIFGQDLFKKWLTHYFSRPAQTDHLSVEADDTIIDVKMLFTQNAMLIKPPAVKIMLTPLQTPRTYSVSVGAYTFDLTASDLNLIDALAQETPFSAEVFTNHPELLQNLLDQRSVMLC